MRMLTARLLFGLCVIGLWTGAQAQKHHDPLTSREVDQMRDSAQEPNRRIDLLIGFARERVMAIDRLSSATNTGTTKDGLDDAAKLTELLGDLADLIDELDDNLAMYSEHSEDLRRPLRHVLQAEAGFQRKLKTLGDNATPPQKRRIAAALEDAFDSLQSSMEGANAMLASQIAKRGEEKNKEDLDRQEAQEGRPPPER
jgi:hypothetical protein